MSANKIEVSVVVDAPTLKVWDYYTNPMHIVHWNFADPSWHCPSAENEMVVGGKYQARMEARDGSMGFDFIAFYTMIKMGECFEYEFGDRKAMVVFNALENGTEVVVTFDPETIHSVELQKAGWQSILNNFKFYTESN